MSDDPRTYYHRRRNKKRTLVNKSAEATTPVENQISEKTEFEFVISYGSTTFEFGFSSESVPTEADASVIHDLVLRGTSCDDDEFEMFGLEIEMTENLSAVAIMKELIEKVSQVRSEMSAYDALPQIHPDSNVVQTSINETETTMSINETNSSSSINETTDNTMNNTTAMNEAMKQAAANATDAAEKITATTEQAAPGAAATIAAGASLAAATGLVATKGFVARNKKKLLIAGGLVGLSVGGYFAWQRYGAALLGAGEAVVEQLPSA